MQQRANQQLARLYYLACDTNAPKQQVTADLANMQPMPASMVTWLQTNAHVYAALHHVNSVAQGGAPSPLVPAQVQQWLATNFALL